MTRLLPHAVMLLLLVGTSAAVVAAVPASGPVAAPAGDSATLAALDQIEASRPGTGPAPAASALDTGAGPDVWFYVPVLAVAAAIGVAASVVGTFALLRREALVALALPQAVAVGAAVGLRYGWPTLPPAFVAAAVALGYLVHARRGGGRGSDAGGGRMAVPALYVGGLCGSFLVIAGSGAHVAELQNLFTGIDVAVTPADAAVAVPVLLAAAVACAALWRRWLVSAQAPAAAELAGRSPARSDALFLALLTIVLLLGTHAQGVVMVLAMLFLPSAIVRPWVRRIPSALAAAAAVSVGCVAVAFAAANRLDWPLSHTVGGVGTAALVLSRAADAVARRR